jgi:hypothetical protein
MERVSVSAEKTNRVAAVLLASEENIRDLAQRTKLDSYWRAYFWLSRR